MGALTIIGKVLVERWTRRQNAEQRGLMLTKNRAAHTLRGRRTVPLFYKLIRDAERVQHAEDPRAGLRGDCPLIEVQQKNCARSDLYVAERRRVITELPNEGAGGKLPAEHPTFAPAAIPNQRRSDDLYRQCFS
jgi:hypothetical protein